MQAIPVGPPGSGVCAVAGMRVLQGLPAGVGARLQRRLARRTDGTLGACGYQIWSGLEGQRSPLRSLLTLACKMESMFPVCSLIG